MDGFNLKKDNRKKFQDKQKLKRRHATPSDRKYHRLNTAETTDEPARTGDEVEVETPQLGSNEDRYVKDIVYEREDPEWEQLSQQTTQLLKNKLMQEQEIDTNRTLASKSYKKKDYLKMDVNELNHVIDSGATNTEIDVRDLRDGNSDQNEAATTGLTSQGSQKGHFSKLPSDLNDEQEALDDFL